MFPNNSPPAMCDLPGACSSCQIGPLFPSSDACFLSHIPTVMEAQMGPSPYQCIFQLSDGTFPMHILAVRWNLSNAYSSCPMGPFQCIFLLSDWTLPMPIPAVRKELSYAYSSFQMGPLGLFSKFHMGPFPGIFQL